MATVSDSVNILAILKRYYKDGIESVLARNSPVLKEMPLTRVEGESYNFAVLYGRGGAVSGYAYSAAEYAIQNDTARNTTFSVTPGYMFSDYTTNYMEKTASKSARGAYQKAEANKFFAAMEAFRKTLAKSLYMTGYGELGTAGSAVASAATTGNTITLSDSTIIGLDIGTKFQVVSGADPSVAPATPVYEVTAIDEDTNTVTFSADTGGGAIAVGDWLVLTGGRDANGGPEYPIGLEGWLPTVGNRTGGTWNTYIARPFMGNTQRGLVPNRLAGQFVNGGTISTTNTLSSVISKLFRKVRRYGGIPDFIVLNDADRLYLQGELNEQQTYWQSVAGKREAPGAAVGFAEIAYAFSTSWLDRVIDDPYCPEGKFYILSMKNGSRPNIEFAMFTNGEKGKVDGIPNNEPGKPDPNSETEEYADSPFKLNIDDLVTVTDAGKGRTGTMALVETRFAGNLCIYAPATCGVGVFTR